MRLFFTKIKPFSGMIFVDLLSTIIWIGSLYWTFIGIKDPIIRYGLVFSILGMFAFVMYIRYRTMYRCYGYDAVTGGINKQELQMIAQSMLDGHEDYVLVYTNLDKFKMINDAYGSEEGDFILRRVQRIFDSELVSEEVCGRIMADNFGILMHFHSLEKLEERLRRMFRQVSDLHNDEGEVYNLHVSCGICDAKNGEYDFSRMMERANLARENIRKGVFSISMGVYDNKDREQLERERHIEMKMQDALTNKHFRPFLQAKYEMKNERVAGAEALCRWFDPEEGMIYPGEFIPLFEKNGFIVNLDLYMFEEVCKIIDRWEMAGCSIIPISVNLSRANFNNLNFFKHYKDIMKKYNIPKKSIEFELTESLFYENFNQVNELIDEIHSMGFLCSIDDFGSGYSSLNMLKDVNVDILKLDRVFFSETDSEKSQNIVKSVIELAQALNLKTISEGIEYQSQLDFLKEVGCDYVQGYIYAKPVEVDVFEQKVYFEEAPNNYLEGVED